MGDRETIRREKSQNDHKQNQPDNYQGPPNPIAAATARFFSPYR